MKGNTPTLISGVPKRAPSLARIRSQHSASPSAPASTCPLAAQTVGLPRPMIFRNSRGKRSVAKCLCTIGTSAVKPSSDAPAENTFSCEEVSTTQRTRSSSPACPKASVSSSSSSLESAFRLSGLLSVTRATPSSRTS